MINIISLAFLILDILVCSVKQFLHFLLAQSSSKLASLRRNIKRRMSSRLRAKVSIHLVCHSYIPDPCLIPDYVENDLSPFMKNMRNISLYKRIVLESFLRELVTWKQNEANLRIQIFEIFKKRFSVKFPVDQLHYKFPDYKKLKENHPKALQELNPSTSLDFLNSLSFRVKKNEDGIKSYFEKNYLKSNKSITCSDLYQPELWTKNDTGIRPLVIESDNLDFILKQGIKSSYQCNSNISIFLNTNVHGLSKERIIATVAHLLKSSKEPKILFGLSCSSKECIDDGDIDNLEINQDYAELEKAKGLYLFAYNNCSELRNEIDAIMKNVYWKFPNAAWKFASNAHKILGGRVKIELFKKCLPEVLDSCDMVYTSTRYLCTPIDHFLFDTISVIIPLIPDESRVSDKVWAKSVYRPVDSKSQIDELPVDSLVDRLETATRNSSADRRIQFLIVYQTKKTEESEMAEERSLLEQSIQGKIKFKRSFISIEVVQWKSPQEDPSHPYVQMLNYAHQNYAIGSIIMTHDLNYFLPFEWDSVVKQVLSIPGVGCGLFSLRFSLPPTSVHKKPFIDAIKCFALTLIINWFSKSLEVSLPGQPLFLYNTYLRIIDGFPSPKKYSTFEAQMSSNIKDQVGHIVVTPAFTSSSCLYYYPGLADRGKFIYESLVHFMGLLMIRLARLDFGEFGYFHRKFAHSLFSKTLEVTR